jgi:hypothetical protein
VLLPSVSPRKGGLSHPEKPEEAITPPLQATPHAKWCFLGKPDTAHRAIRPCVIRPLPIKEVVFRLRISVRVRHAQGAEAGLSDVGPGELGLHKGSAIPAPHQLRNLKPVLRPFLNAADPNSTSERRWLWRLKFYTQARQGFTAGLLPCKRVTVNDLHIQPRNPNAFTSHRARSTRDLSVANPSQSSSSTSTAVPFRMASNAEHSAIAIIAAINLAWSPRHDPSERTR